MRVSWTSTNQYSTTRCSANRMNFTTKNNVKHASNFLCEIGSKTGTNVSQRPIFSTQYSEMWAFGWFRFRSMSDFRHRERISVSFHYYITRKILNSSVSSTKSVLNGLYQFFLSVDSISPFITHLPIPDWSNENSLPISASFLYMIAVLNTDAQGLLWQIPHNSLIRSGFEW